MLRLNAQNPVTVILLAAVTAFGVASVTSDAAKAPATHGISTGVVSAKPLAAPSGPSAVDVNRAQTRAINDLKNQLAQVKQDVRNASLDAASAQNSVDDLTQCLGGYYLTANQDGLIENADGTEPAYFIAATLDPTCAEESS